MSQNNINKKKILNASRVPISTRSTTLKKGDLSLSPLNPLFTSTQISPSTKRLNDLDYLKKELTATLKDIAEEKINIALNHIKEEIEYLRQESEELKEENVRLKAMMINQQDPINNHYIKEYADLKIAYEQQKDIIKQLEEEILSIKRNISDIHKQSIKNEERLEDIIQDKLTNFCVLSGPNIPPTTENENTNQILNNLLKNKLRIDLSKNSITDAYRLGKPPTTGPDKRPIKFRVKDEKTKSEIIKQIILSKSKIYINEFLSPFKRSLLKQALSIRKLNNTIIQSCHIRNGILYVRKSLESTYTQINSKQDLDLYIKLLTPPNDTVFPNQNTFMLDNI